MSKILEFCGQNWKFILTVLLAVGEIIFLLFRTKKSRKMVVDSLVSILPDFICDAEKKFSDGESKIKYVLSCCIDHLEVETKESRFKLIRLYGDLLVEYIEKILSTPQKKGI